jgi:hypothetical protein
MEVRSNGERYKCYKSYERTLHEPYDYERFGLNNKILSHKLTNTKNPILKGILDIYEKNLVFLMKYVDVLQNIFNYNWKNR